MAVSEEQRRQIAVHAREVGEFEIDVAPIELDPAAGVGATVGEHFVANPIGEARGGLARPGSFAACPDAGGHGWLEALAPQPPGKPHDVGRVVLAIHSCSI
jgi:hypothetical protein